MSAFTVVLVNVHERSQMFTPVNAWAVNTLRFKELFYQLYYINQRFNLHQLKIV
jgi:hypothetical protein